MVTIPRPRALVVHSSMSSSTASAARAVAEGLDLEHMDVTLTDVSHAPQLDAVTHDLVVVGAPTHAFSLSPPAFRAGADRRGRGREPAEAGLREWLANPGRRPAHGGRLAAAFDTRVNRVRHLPNAAANREAQMLIHSGFSIMGKPVAFLVEDILGPLVTGELERAQDWGRRIAIATQDRLAGAAPGRR